MSSTWGRSGCDHMVVGFAAIIAISSQLTVSVLDTTLSD